MVRDPLGWTDLSVELLEALDPDDFEQFCFDLIRFEAYDRHDGPVVDGPAKRSVADGGRDILLTVKRAPHLSKADYQKAYHLGPLTEDDQARTAYSCKSGDNWLNLALRDVQERKGLGRTVEVLLEGGYFKLLINTIGNLDGQVTRGGVQRTPHEHLAAALWERMKQERPDAEDPSAHIEILDAHALTDFLRARQPEGGSVARWADRFSVLPLLYSLDDWRAWHREDRDEPEFTDDAEREALRDALLRFIRHAPSTPRELAAWLVGPPGVGKTRLVLETLASDPAIEQRVRVARTPEEALDALDRGRLLVRHPAVVLIVDDCPPIQVDPLAARFVAATRTHTSARLLIVTPAPEQALAKARRSPRWYLKPLDPTATRTLAAHVLGVSTDAQGVHDIARLSEGYPWFVDLLARESRVEDRPPRDVREAAQWALAASSEASPGPELEALRLRRARCLLAASITRRIDWSELSPAQREDVSRAVGLERGQDLFDGADQCVRRAILRRNQGWKYKYVTPLVLEREVIAWLLDPDGGHDPGGRTLVQYGQLYLDDFFDTLLRLGLPRELLVGMARVGVEDLERAPADWGELRSLGLLGPRLRFIARHAPSATARELRRRIEASSIDELRACVEERRGIVFALDELATRADAFEDAEAALLRLAQAENEAYANNATAIWAGLFLVELNATHRSLAQRMALLEDRLNDPDPAVRAVALQGVQAVLATRAFRLAHEAIDGAWTAPAGEEVHLARAQAWTLLAERFGDPHPYVAAKAKRAVAGELRGAIRAGMGEHAMAILAAHLADFTESERVQLRDALAAVRTYDAGWLAPDSEYPGSLEALLAPSSFKERLRQRVGAWGPAALRENDDALDEALAREGLAGDVPLLSELDWLVSDEAVRAHVFAYALGRCDERGTLLAGLREQARTCRGAGAWRKRAVFARYLGGWAQAGRGVAAEAVLSDLKLDAAEAPLLALAVMELGATDEQLAWIRSAVQGDLLDGACVLELGRNRRWLLQVSEAAFAAFAGALVEGTLVEHAAAALELLVERIEERPERAATSRALLLRALERLAPHRVHGMTDHFWELGARLLVDQGEATRVAELALVALSQPRGAKEHAWAALHAAAARDARAAWRAVAAALDRRDPAAGRLQMAFMFHHRSSFAWPAEDVLAWVGQDARRGRTAAAIVRPRAPELDPIWRALVQRFGPRSSVAGEIIARVHSTDGLVASLAEHDAEQLSLARAWLDDSDVSVRAFAERLIESLTRSHEQHVADEEDERRRWGT
ncbi:uncharacterized protein SOCEGT47_081090 [Sorangium cellulosum]|uniref:Uncharacterized protein n=1 Tax=Sorangium cellulosum TaxID=56 RepID=A0A4P2QCP1_SORCE|nr:ATP-binding protein [Sorangium cellulosum]AUX27517.1 uncharacterized protein SOCEGT47_081090 [Sorangium cellulosum]